MKQEKYEVAGFSFWTGGKFVAGEGYLGVAYILAVPHLSEPLRPPYEVTTVKYYPLLKDARDIARDFVTLLIQSGEMHRAIRR